MRVPGQGEEEPSFRWADIFHLTKAIFSILFWPLVALLALMIAIGGVTVAFSVHWVWGVTAMALIGVGVAVWGWLDANRRSREP